jgi:hypothetical protein
VTTKKRSLRPTSKTAWFEANDVGPHLAVLPTKKVVRFRIPDQSALLRSGRLPEQLREVALLIAAHPGGAEGYFEELVQVAMIRGEGQETISRAIALGLDLTHVLVSEMLVEPEVTAEEVASGKIHELDVRMLLEFAERRRSTDAEGNRLPIITLDEWARFRDVPRSPEGAGDGGANGHIAPGTVPDADAGDV